MTTNEIYQQIKNAVLYYPIDEKKCLTPQTFRVLINEANLTAPNLGATILDKFGPFFFSRAWAANNYDKHNIVFDYPLVVVTPLSRTLFTTKNSRLRIQIGVLDKTTNGCDGCDPDSCEARNPEQVRQGTENMLINILSYLKTVGLYETDFGNRYDVQGRIDELKRANLISRANLLKRSVIFGETQIEFEITPIEPLSEVVGSAATFNVNLTECLTVEFDFSGAMP